jgi:glycosyltransferase involved in cell wall biosynthesis
MDGKKNRRLVLEMGVRIFQVINSYSNFEGGAEKIVRQLHTRFLDRGLASRLIGLKWDEDHELEYANTSRAKTPYSPLSFFFLIKQLRESRRNDIVHCHLFPSNFYCAVLKKLRVIKCTLITTEHNTENKRRYSYVGRWIDRFTYSQVDHIIAISKGTKDSLNKWLPFTTKKTRVIYNGIDLYYKAPILRKPNNPLRIVSVGRLHYQKNYEMAISAFEHINLPFEYHIAGMGDLKSQLEQLVKHSSAKDKIKLLGQVENIPELLRHYDIFLMPSKYEGFGISAIEAMNASLPCILSDVPGLNELIVNESDCALFVNPESDVSIANAIKELLLNDELRLQKGRAAFKNSKSYSLEETVSNYLLLYKQLEVNE